MPEENAVSDLADAFRGLAIETPSWGYGGTDVFERIDAAAQVHRLTGTAGSVALRFPPDAVEDYEHLRDYISARGLHVGSVHSTGVEAEHLIECMEIATALGSPGLALRLAGDGRRPPLACVDVELVVGAADWGLALLTCQALGDRARVLLDCAPGANLALVVAMLAEQDRFGGLRIAGSRNPFELFEILVALRAGDLLGRLAVENPHGVEATILGIVDLHEACAKALLVDREALREAQEFGDDVCAREVLREAFCTDVRPWCAAARAALDAAENPIVALRQSDYVET